MIQHRTGTTRDVAGYQRALPLIKWGHLSTAEPKTFALATLCLGSHGSWLQLRATLWKIGNPEHSPNSKTPNGYNKNGLIFHRHD